MSVEQIIPPVAEDGVIASLRNVSKSYAGVLAVQNVTIDIPAKEFVILTGHSGSGKSTALSMLEGVVTPDAGEVLLFGRNLSAMKPKELAKLKRDHIGIGFQDAMLDRSFSVADNIRQTANGNHRKIENKRIVELAGRFGMAHALFREAGGLSGGEQLRVSLMASMATEPELILLDEPTSAIDTKGKSEAFKWLRRAVKEEEATVVMVTHDPDIARDFADREYVLESGRVIDMHRLNVSEPETTIVEYLPGA